MNKKQQRAMKIAAQQALVDGAAGRELTAEERAQFEALQREINALTLEIEAEERQQSQGAAAPQATGEGTGTGQSATAPQGQRNLDGQDAATRAVAAERQRVQDITAMCRDFDVDPADHIRDGHTVDQVRAAILDGLRQTVLVNIFGNTLVGNISTKTCLHWCHIIVVRMRSYIIVPINI